MGRGNKSKNQRKDARKELKDYKKKNSTVENLKKLEALGRQKLASNRLSSIPKIFRINLSIGSEDLILKLCHDLDCMADRNPSNEVTEGDLSVNSTNENNSELQESSDEDSGESSSEDDVDEDDNDGDENSVSENDDDESEEDIDDLSVEESESVKSRSTQDAVENTACNKEDIDSRELLGVLEKAAPELITTKKDILPQTDTSNTLPMDERSDLTQFIRPKEFTEDRKRRYIRKLIRDDRRISRLEYAERMAIKELRKDHFRAIYNAATNNSTTQIDIISNRKKLISQNIILKITCETQLSIFKTLVINTSTTLEEITQMARNKFTAGKKFNSLLLLPEKYLITPSNISCLMDGSKICLSKGNANQQTSLTVASPHVTEAVGSGSKSKNATSNTNLPKVPDTSCNPMATPALISIPMTTSSPPPPLAPVTPPTWSPYRPTDFKNISSENDYSSSGHTGNVPLVANADISNALVQRERNRQTGHSSLSEAAIEMQRQRSQLPIYQHKTALLAAIQNHQTILVSGATGSGKTTQLPQYIYEDRVRRGQGAETYIVCTQPRRIAAITVAERVAAERSEACGDIVGYQIRLQSRCGPNTRILYCTTGILLRKLQDGDHLHRVSHVIVDEAHERQVETDFLLCLLKQRITSHPDLKLIIMSATLHEKLFSDYFYQCPVTYVEGRAFPVTIHYQCDIQQLISNAQRVIGNHRNQTSTASNNSKNNNNNNNSKKKNNNNNNNNNNANNNSKSQSNIPNNNKSISPHINIEEIAELVIRIIQTYSDHTTISLSKISATGERKKHTTNTITTATTTTTTMPPSNTPTPLPTTTTNSKVSKPMGDAILIFLPGIQVIDKLFRLLRNKKIDTLNAQVFTLHSSMSAGEQRKVFIPAAPGAWRIILSTDIAETSVTLPDVTHVIDTGLHKEMQYDPQVEMSCLRETIISRAAARQRAGRAGRVGPGHCWRLYSEDYIVSSDIASFETANNISMDSLTLKDNTTMSVNLNQQTSNKIHLKQQQQQQQQQQHQQHGHKDNNRNISTSSTSTINKGKPLPMNQLASAHSNSNSNSNSNTTTTTATINNNSNVSFIGMKEFPLPEMLRVPLEEVILQVLLLDLGAPHEFLSQCLEPPSPQQIQSAMSRLLTMGAIVYSHNNQEDNQDEDNDQTSSNITNGSEGSNGQREPTSKGEELLSSPSAAAGTSTSSPENKILYLTALGYHLAKLPVDVRLGKMMIMGSLLGCLDSILIIAAALSGKTPFSAPHYCREKADLAYQTFLKRYSSSSSSSSGMNESRLLFSDHLAIVNAFRQWEDTYLTSGRSAAYSFCKDYYLSSSALEEIRAMKQQYLMYLQDAAFCDSTNTTNSGSREEGDNDLEGGYGCDTIVRQRGIYTTIPDVTIDELLVCCGIFAGLFPQVVRVYRQSPPSSKTKSKSHGKQRSELKEGKVIIEQPDGIQVAIHPTSLVAKSVSNLLSTGTEKFLVYHKKVATSRVYLYDCSTVPILGVLLFGGPIVTAKDRLTLKIGGWIQIKTAELHGILLKRLQREFDTILRDMVEISESKQLTTSTTSTTTTTTASVPFGNTVLTIQKRKEILIDVFTKLLKQFK